MTTDIIFDVTLGPVRVIPVPATSVDAVAMQGDSYLVGWSLRDASGASAGNTEGSQTSPAAGTVITQLTLLNAGSYLVNWSVELAGTVAAADANNFGLYVSNVQQTTSLNQGAVGNYPQQQAELTVGLAGAIEIKNVGAATVGAVYSAQLSIIPVNAVNTIVELQDGGNALAEISMEPGKANTQWLGDAGILTRSRINIHVIQGTVTGALYAKYIT